MGVQARRGATVCVLVLALSASARAQDPRRGDVRQAMDGFMRALNSLNADSMSLYFADDVTAFVPLVQAERVEGKAALVRIFRAFADRTRLTVDHLTIVPEEVEVVQSPTLAVVTFNVRDVATMVRRRTFVWERTGNRWLIRHMHASDLTRPSAPND